MRATRRLLRCATRPLSTTMRSRFTSSRCGLQTLPGVDRCVLILHAGPVPLTPWAGGGAG